MLQSLARIENPIIIEAGGEVIKRRSAAQIFITLTYIYYHRTSLTAENSVFRMSNEGVGSKMLDSPRTAYRKAIKYWSHCCRAT